MSRNMEIRRKKQHRVRRVIFAVVIFAAVFAGVFFGVQWLTKTGVFRIPGVVYYDESLNSEELEILQGIFTDEVDLDKDLHVTATNYLEKPELGAGEFLDNILVPVTDFYSTETNVEAGEVNLLFTDEHMREANYKMISLDELNFQKKLLSLNSKYYLDEFDAGAVFRVIKFESEKYEEEIAPLISEAFAKTWPEKSSVLTMVQTGVTALSRGMNEKLSKVGDAKYFSANIAEYLSSFDLTHTSNEASFTDYATANNICSDKRFVDTLLDIGLDIVELTGNHNQDCGDLAAIETIDIYNSNNIKTVGGGKTAAEAAVPLQIDEKGTDITFLAYNLSTGGATLDNTPGANQYIEERAASEIKTAKERGDVVIVDIQYYECSSYASEYEDPTCDYVQNTPGDEMGFFRHLVDLGADIVVGTSAHQAQPYELYGNGVIYYGLGNLFFDQVWWPGTTRSLTLGHYFYNNRLLQTKIVPTVYDATMQTRRMDEETTKWFLDRLVNERPEPAVSAQGDLQSAVNDWAASVGGNRSVLVYDLDKNELIGAYNADESYNTASLYKLFVVYEGYRRVQSGEWQGDATAGATGKTILECLDLAIRESYSPCAETLWDMIGHENLNTIIRNDFGITNSDIAHLISNPRDILTIMKKFYEHPDIKDESLIAKMKDSFLNQPTTTYNWRQGLPSGFTRANVYNKVGWDWNGKSWNIYHDAAIVELPENNRHFIVVVMTNQVLFQEIRELGKSLESIFSQASSAD